VTVPYGNIGPDVDKDGADRALALGPSYGPDCLKMDLEAPAGGP
jgi:hypothetical protein